MSENKTDEGSKNTYIPRFLVTQKEYDEASLEERQHYNYAVEDETLLTPPKTYSIPVEDSDD